MYQNQTGSSSLSTKLEGHNFELVGGDTDGLAFKKPDQSPFTKEERLSLLADLNTEMDGLIHWEDDGLFPIQMVIRTKNYILVDESGKRKTKGSALKASTKEKALKLFVQEMIDLLLNDKQDEIYSTYLRYAKETLSLTDISQWCSKHTVTKAVLKGKGTAQVRLREALKGKPVQEGDKFYVFFETPEKRCLLENFTGVYDSSILLGKLYDTLCIFETVFDVKSIPNLTLKKNSKILKELTDANFQLQMSKV